MSFADNLKKLREQKGYSQAQLAKMIGIAQKQISNYETGISIPNAVNAFILAKKLDTTVEKLVEE